MLKKYKILLALLLLLTGCGLFNMRDSENPVDPRSNFVPPTSPDILISNFLSAISEKNLNNYLLCFVDSNLSTRRFKYTADANSLVQYPAVFRFWSLNNERYYFSSLVTQTPSSNTSNLFLSNIFFNPTSDSVIMDADYLLRFDHQKQNVSKTLKGKLRWIMGSDSRNLWSIHSWIDFKNNDSDTTWSVLKANFTN